jgi:hypothetical protein
MDNRFELSDVTLLYAGAFVVGALLIGGAGYTVLKLLS